MSALTIGSNIAALKAQRQLNASTQRLAQASERLSSGMRINRASDDAAGLSIVSALNKDVRVYGQAIRNGNDAISALNLSGDTLGELSGALMRIQELAEQAANGSLNRAQRLSLDVEGKALTDEFNRLVASTAFNGQALLDGQLGDVGIQLGFGADGKITVSFGSGIRRNLGSGLSSTIQSYTDEDANGGSDGVSADFNGDGITDLAVTDNSTITSLRVLLGNANGGFTSSNIYLGLSGASSIVAADLNGDGVTDLAASDGSTLYTLIGRGNGTFNGALSTAESGMSGVLRAGDINGDGKIDLLGITKSTATITIRLGNGNGTYQTASTTTSTGVANDLQLADLNNDGKLDIVTTDTAGRRIVTRLGNGNGTFGGAATQSSINTPGSLAVLDLNYDGFLDVVTMQTAGTQVATYLGNGSGGFSSSTTTTLGSAYTSMAVGDIDGDGLADLVLGSANGRAVGKGRGDGTFDNLLSYTVTGAGGIKLILGDFNGDGVNDVSAQSGGAVTINLSTTTSGSTLQRVNLTTQTDARSALGLLTAALGRIQTEMSLVGSSQSRILSALNTIAAKRLNSDAAASRIMDADIASESAIRIREQLLQQAASAVLANANQVPQVALSLLR